MNFTLSAPNGTTNHGNPDLVCTPAGWTDYVTFFFANYVAHAASIILEPGAGLRRTLMLVLVALVLPSSGVTRAVSAIWRHAATERSNPLKRAARARALCMVLKRPKIPDASATLPQQQPYTIADFGAMLTRKRRAFVKRLTGKKATAGPKPDPDETERIALQQLGRHGAGDSSTESVVLYCG